MEDKNKRKKRNPYNGKNVTGFDMGGGESLMSKDTSNLRGTLLDDDGGFNDEFDSYESVDDRDIMGVDDGEDWEFADIESVGDYEDRDILKAVDEAESSGYDFTDNKSMDEFGDFGELIESEELLNLLSDDAISDLTEFLALYVSDKDSLDLEQFVDDMEIAGHGYDLPVIHNLYTKLSRYKESLKSSANFKDLYDKKEAESVSDSDTLKFREVHSGQGYYLTEKSGNLCAGDFVMVNNVSKEGDIVTVRFYVFMDSNKTEYMVNGNKDDDISFYTNKNVRY